MTEYEIAINEVQTGAFEPDAYRRACESANGEASQIHANYVSLRVKDLLGQVEQPAPSKVGASIGATLIRILGVVCLGVGFGMAASRYAFLGAIVTPLLASTLIIFGFSIYQGARALHPHLLHWLIRWPLVFSLWFIIAFPTYSFFDELKREQKVADLLESH